LAISVDWPNRIISVPLVDLTFVETNPLTGRSLYALDLDVFRLTLKSLEDDGDGMAYPITHLHNPPVTFGGATYARQLILINAYSITFENGTYGVRLDGANSNVYDVTKIALRFFHRILQVWLSQAMALIKLPCKPL